MSSSSNCRMSFPLLYLPSLTEWKGLPFSKKIIVFIHWLCWVFTAAWAFSLVAASGSHSLLAVCRLLIAVASLVVEHKALGHEGLSSCGSWALECRLSSCGAWAQLLYGIFPHQGSIPCLLHLCLISIHFTLLLFYKKIKIN